MRAIQPGTHPPKNKTNADAATNHNTNIAF